MRIFSLIAGIAAFAVAIGRYVMGMGELAGIVGAVGPNAQGALVGIVWHGLTYIMAVMGAALIGSAWLGRETAVVAAMLATAIFGGIAAMMAIYAGSALVNPVAFYPFYLFAGVAVLSGIAAARA